MTPHPHVHMVSLDGAKWIAKRPDLFLPMRALSALFLHPMMESLVAAHKAGKLVFHGHHAHLVNARSFATFLKPLRRT